MVNRLIRLQLEDEEPPLICANAELTIGVKRIVDRHVELLFRELDAECRITELRLQNVDETKTLII